MAKAGGGMMERLTTKEYNNLIECTFCSEQSICYDSIPCDEIEKAIERLREYENTGLTPEQMIEHERLFVEMREEFEEYKSLENEGLLLKLPCKVGDTVYCIHDRYTKCSAYNERFEEYNCQGCELECDSKKEYYIAETITDTFFCALSMLEGRLGKSIFLTKEEAEAKLKEMEGE